MNERQRADFLARAIDDLISGLEPVVPADLDRKDVDAIMHVARTRLDAGRVFAHSGLQYEGAVWQHVLERIQRANAGARAGWTAAPPEASEYSPAAGDRDLTEVAVLRRHMSAQLIAFAETHREDVWQRVQARIIMTQQDKRPFLGFLGQRPGQAYANLLAPALDSVAAGRPAEIGEASLDGVIKTAWTRKAASQVAMELAEPRRDRVWSRVRANIDAKPAAAPRFALWPRAVAVGGIAAVVIAALGPVPASGFANHPAAEFVRFVGGHIGVAETGTPPEPGDGTSVTGSAATTEQATIALGISVVEPAAPAGFEAVSSEVFSSGITSESGVFVVSFAGTAGHTITVYQEAATGTLVAAASGSARDVLLTDGTAATYFDGAWETADGSFAWVLGGSQTLVFDDGGVRTIVVHAGDADAGFVTDFAGTLASAR